MKKLGLIFLLTGSVFAFQPPSVNMAGTILDLNGEPVADAKIHLTHKEGQKLDKVMKTKKSGRFNALSIPAGLINISVSKPGYQSQDFEFDLRPERKRAILRLIPEGKSSKDLGPQSSLSGQVVDSSGNGIPNVTLMFSSENLAGFEKKIETDENGTFKVEMLNEAIVKIHAQRSDYRDTIYLYFHPKNDYEIPAKDLAMQTLEEAYAELGEAAPKKEMKPEAQAIELYNLAVGPYKEGKLDQAAGYALSALEKDPNQANATKMLVYIYSKKGDWANADKYVKSFLSQNPGDPGMTKYAEKIAHGLKNPGAVVTSSSGGGTSASGLFNKAVKALNANDDAKATTYLNQVLEKDNTYALAYYELGKVFIREFDFDKAIYNLKLYLKHAPKDHKYRNEATDLIVSLSE